MPSPRNSARELSAAEAVREGLEQAMHADPRVLVIGEGVPDPKAIFGTTRELRERFGPDRVFDMPLSENGMTGICIGAALKGLRPVMVHQRIDFSMLAMDQLVNNAAKWHYMFNGEQCVPLVIRCVVGRGWGQGPQHSQSLQALFSHVPGLKVVLPVTPADHKGLLLSAIDDPNPVIFIEHRWLQGLRGPVDPDPIRSPIGEARIARPGRDVTVAAFSYAVVEALEAAQAFASRGVELEVIDLRTASPLDVRPVVESVRRTGRLLVLDTGWRCCGLSAEVLARVSELAWDDLTTAPRRLALREGYPGTAAALAVDFYPSAQSIAQEVCELLPVVASGLREELEERLRPSRPRDVPHARFSGPF